MKKEKSTLSILENIRKKIQKIEEDDAVETDTDHRFEYIDTSNSSDKNSDQKQILEIKSEIKDSTKEGVDSHEIFLDSDSNKDDFFKTEATAQIKEEKVLNQNPNQVNVLFEKNLDANLGEPENSDLDLESDPSKELFNETQNKYGQVVDNGASSKVDDIFAKEEDNNVGVEGGLFSDNPKVNEPEELNKDQLKNIDSGSGQQKDPDLENFEDLEDVDLDLDLEEEQEKSEIDDLEIDVNQLDKVDVSKITNEANQKKIDKEIFENDLDLKQNIHLKDEEVLKTDEVLKSDEDLKDLDFDFQEKKPESPPKTAEDDLDFAEIDNIDNSDLDKMSIDGLEEKNNDKKLTPDRNFELGIIKEEIANKTASSISKLIEAIPKKQQPFQDVALGSKNSETIEELVTRILTPKLEDWLNENLPVLVEKIVSSEIKKIVNKTDI